MLDDFEFKWFLSGFIGAIIGVFAFVLSITSMLFLDDFFMFIMSFYPELERIAKHNLLGGIFLKLAFFTIFGFVCGILTLYLIMLINLIRRVYSKIRK
jgi:hypothetical protein